jgi:hypothetical protein
MGTLNPGATYIYERNGQEIYAREHGATERMLIGYDYEMQESESESGKSLRDRMQESQLWHQIRIEAQTNPALQQAMDCVKIIYQLSKTQ